MPDSRFVPAYSKRTGRKLPHNVPEHWFDNPVLGKRIQRTPRSTNKTRTDNTQTPATGDDTKKEK